MSMRNRSACRPESGIKRAEERVFGAAKIKLASLDDIFQMKLLAYQDRKEARDLFDISCILKQWGSSCRLVKELLSKGGMPKNFGGLSFMALDQTLVVELDKMVSDAS